MKFSAAASEKLFSRTTDWKYLICFSIFCPRFADGTVYMTAHSGGRVNEVGACFALFFHYNKRLHTTEKRRKPLVLTHSVKFLCVKFAYVPAREDVEAA